MEPNPDCEFESVSLSRRDKGCDESLPTPKRLDVEPSERELPKPSLVAVLDTRLLDIALSRLLEGTRNP